MKILKNRYVIIAFLVIIILAIVFILPMANYVSFELDDRCGPIMNMISHTIKDETVCKTKCKSQCEVKDLTFRKAEFYLNPLGCNNCTCFCK